MNINKDNITVTTFFGDDISRYEFRRSIERLSSLNIEIKSFQLVGDSSIGSDVRMQELLRALKYAVSRDNAVLFGLWFSNRWEGDSAVNRKIGWKRFLTEQGRQSFSFSSMGVIDDHGHILHWGDAQINPTNFSLFVAEISHYENGALFACDAGNWPDIRKACLKHVAKRKGNMPVSLSNLNIVKFALSVEIPVITATNWIEDDVLELSVFSHRLLSTVTGI